MCIAFIMDEFSSLSLSRQQRMRGNHHHELDDDIGSRVPSASSSLHLLQSVNLG